MEWKEEWPSRGEGEGAADRFILDAHFMPGSGHLDK